MDPEYAQPASQGNHQVMSTAGVSGGQYTHIYPDHSRSLEEPDIVQSDALSWLSTLPTSSVDLVATDPPYMTQYDWGSYMDKWPSRNEYIAEMREVAQEAHRVLKPTGSLYWQCDWHADAYLRVMLDEVFGDDNFRNAIIWVRQRGGGGSQHRHKRWRSRTDTILYYARSDDAELRPYDKTQTEQYIEDNFTREDADGRRYIDDSSHLFRAAGQAARPGLCFEWHGYTAPHPSGWRLSKERMDEEHAKGNIVIRRDGTLERRKYLDEYAGFLVGNIWDDIPLVASSERTGYPTQKPLDLYDRIIKASTNEGDMVADPFAGSGTTLVAAKRCGRRFQGCDTNREAVDLARRRIGELLL